MKNGNLVTIGKSSFGTELLSTDFMVMTHMETVYKIIFYGKTFPIQTLNITPNKHDLN